MAIIDRIKFDGLKSREWLIYKHPAESIVRGAQLIVGEGQAAVFVKSGRIFDLFNAGTYTLDAENLPLLQKFLNIPFGGDTPLTAEIFYINITSKLDITWGTSDPITLIDPKYNIRLRIRAFGQLGLRVDDYSIFLRELIGVMPASEMINANNIINHFKGLIIQKIKVVIADVIINQQISALEIAAKMDLIAEHAKQKITPGISEYGLRLINFFIKSINFPDEDFNEINRILSQKAEFEIMGDSRYATKRTYDVYEGAANNEGGVAGAFVAGGLGLGMGASIGANAAQTLVDTSPNGIICTNCNNKNASNTKFCSQCGTNLVPPPAPIKTCDKCGTGNDDDAKFCDNCGNSLQNNNCKGCNAELKSGAKFCSKCGKAVE